MADLKSHEFEDAKDAEVGGVVGQKTPDATGVQQGRILRVENSFPAPAEVVHPLEPALDGRNARCQPPGSDLQVPGAQPSHDFLPGFDLVEEFREALGRFLGFCGARHAAYFPAGSGPVESSFANFAQRGESLAFTGGPRT